MEIMDKKVGTIAGPFDKKRAESLRETVQKARNDGFETTMWEGQELDVRFGEHLLEYVELRLGMKGHNGL